MNRLARRDFLRNVGAVASCGLTAGMGWPRNVFADTQGDLEELARWLTKTPRDRLLEGIAGRIRNGIC